MEYDDAHLYSHLQKLSAIKSERDLENMLTLLWKTRKAGLSASEKASLQSLLNLPCIPDLDPVLACLRSLIRKFVRGNLSSGGILKLFPQNLSLDLQTMLVALLEKHQNQWKEEFSKDQNPLARSKFSNQVNAGLPPPLASIPSGIAESPLARQDYFVSQANNILGASTPLITDTNMSHLSPLFLQSTLAPPENTGILPRLKSMTWALENQSAAPTDSTIVVSLKLQDDVKSPSGEMEVKFRLSRDTLDAMLRSLAYIKEQLPTSSGSSEPLRKKQK